MKQPALPEHADAAYLRRVEGDCLRQAKKLSKAADKRPAWDNGHSSKSAKAAGALIHSFYCELIAEMLESLDENRNNGRVTQVRDLSDRQLRKAWELTLERINL